MYRTEHKQYQRNINNIDEALKVVQKQRTVKQSLGKSTMHLIFISILHIIHTYMGQRRYTGYVAQPVH